MKPWRLLFTILLISGLCQGCTRYIAKYDISLASVQRPAKAQDRYGKQILTTYQENNLKKYTFEDKLVKIDWYVDAHQIYLWMTNKTIHSIKISWDDTSIIDIDGQNHRVIHSGVSYADRNRSQPASIISPKTSLADTLFPVDSIQYVDGYWDETTIFPYSITASKSGISPFMTAVKSLIGKRFQVLLPIQIENVINDYIFTFCINSAGVYIPIGGEMPDELVPMDELGDGENTES